MKLRLPLFILIVCGVFFWQAEAAKATRAGESSLPSVFPVVNTTFSDLDARDENNQPIQTPETIENLAGLFQSGLYALLMQADLPSVARTLSILSAQLNLAASALARRLPAAAKIVVAAVVNQLRKFFVSPLVPFAGLLPFFVVCAGALLPLLAVSYPSRIRPADVLRC